MGQQKKKTEKNAEKEKLKELVKKKKEMQEEIDELEGNTAKGVAVSVLTFLVTLGLSMGTFAGMAKLNVGGGASEVLAPVIGDVPIVRSILPAELQRKSPSELAAEQKRAEAEAAKAQAQAEAETQAKAESESEAALQDYADTYSAMKPEDAAKIFDTMMPDQEELIVMILEHLTPDGRAAILSQMSITNAAVLTEKMKQQQVKL